MITDIDTAPWMKTIAVRAAERGVAILGFQRYRSYWYVMIYGETNEIGCPLWSGVSVQEFANDPISRP